jgi:16S rRNA (guanine527-N7)-methyltransferase
VLHSLGIAKVLNFKDGTEVMDLGTGGGFPGIPLAILFPQTQFHLVDSIGKKVKVAQEVATAIGLKNVKFSHARAEEIKELYDFVVTRAVMPMVDLMKVARKNIKKEQNNSVPNGILALKGGELEREIASMRNIATTWELSDFFQEDYFTTKKVVHVTVINKK